MSLLRPAVRIARRSARPTTTTTATTTNHHHARRHLLATRASSSSSSSSSPALPTVAACPSPTCACAPTPEMPEGFEIDRKSPLHGSVAGAAQHVLVCTGRDDWASRIEEDNNGDNLAADLRELIGRGGIYSDPYHNISILNSSFPSSTPRRLPELQTTSAYLLPSFRYVPFLPRVSFDSVEALVKGYLLPERLHPMHDGLSPIHRDRLTRKTAYRRLLWGVRDVADVLVLICGHGGRDRRCGIYGPLLRAEFAAQLPGAGVEVLSGPVDAEPSQEAGAEETAAIEGGDDASSQQAPPPYRGTARVGLISHVGGHKFAGNVIVYLPPGITTREGAPHPLAGHGIWYGRVEPRHVEGIIAETVLKGNVISELFRGGIGRDGRMLRL